MASVCIVHRDGPSTDIDYSLVDRRVREFVLKGELLYEENRPSEENDPYWEAKFIEVVKQQRLHIPDHRGLHAFVIKLIEEGKLKQEKVMEEISNTTCTKCQHCGKWTNYADDEHHKAREARIEELENELRYFVDRCEAGTIRSRRTYARFKAVLDKGESK